MTSSIIRNIRACSLVFVLATFIGLAAAPAHALLLIDFTATVAPDPGGDADLTALYVGGGGIFAAGDPISGTFSYTTNGVTTQDPSNPDGLGRFIYANTNFASATVTATGLGPGAYPIATTTPGSTTVLCDRDAVPACTSTLSPRAKMAFRFLPVK